MHKMIPINNRANKVYSLERQLQPKSVPRNRLTINVSVVYMAQDVMNLMGENTFMGHWKGCTLKIETFWGPEMTTSEANAIWALKVKDFCKIYIKKQQIEYS
jgi:hypothetical protein